jgi:alkylation response protein AidB-like acyl-CoA dehydrogenase
MLPKVAAGEMIFAYGWTEPDVGSDIASAKTTVVRDGNMLTVNGSKRFCSGASVCDYIYTVARLSKSVGCAHPPNTPGISISRIGSLGMKGVGTTDVTVNDVRVPPARRRGWLE